MLIDPAEFINNGTIDVSDGNDSSANGGGVTVEADVFDNNGQIVGVNSSVPEPASGLLLVVGLAALRTVRRNKRNRPG